MTHPETYRDYYGPVVAGEAVPTVYHSLVEAAIRDGVAPERIITAWSLRQSLWSAVSVGGAVLLLAGHWWVGLAVMVLAVWGAIKHTKSLNVRLGYCAAVDHQIGEWAVRRRYLSLIPVPPEYRERWAGRNDALLEQAAQDVGSSSGLAGMLLNIGSAAVLIVAKLGIGLLLIINAFRHPGWLSIGIGGLVGAFFLLQSLVRLPIMFSGLSASRGS
jgi:hypothetical protein